MKRIGQILILIAAVILCMCSKEPPEPLAAFTMSKTSALIGESVQFTNQSKDATSYLWNFGDGSSSSEVSVSHTFQTAGNFTVSLTAKSDIGVNSTSKNITISHPQPVANFSMSKTSAYTGELISFTNLSQNATSYEWAFGDGTVSTLENPTHTYKDVNQFTVTLKAIGPGGNHSVTKTIEILKPANPLLGKWNLIGGTFNNSSISNLSGYREFGNQPVSGGNWTGNSTCNMAQGNDRGTVYGAYEISGNTLKYGYNMTAINWTNNTTNFSRFGVVGLGLQNVTYNISGNSLTITGINTYGTTVLNYQKQ